MDKLKYVYTIVTTDRDGKLRERPVWIRIGTATENHDGSLNVTLDALPSNGKLHIRDSGWEE